MTYAAIWDMDGVLVDTRQQHYLSWAETMAQHGVPITYDQFLPTFGMNNTTILKMWLGPETDPALIRQLDDQKEVSFRRMFGSSIQPLPGVRALLESLQKAGFRQAIASSAPQANIDVLLDASGLRPFFDAIVSAARLPGKPDPAVFLAAAERLAVAPPGCVVLEDSVAGVEGACRAGMRCIAITNTRLAADLQAATLVVDSLESVSPETFSGLLN